MSDYTPSTDELIARARQQTRGITDPSMRERLIIDLADALESVRSAAWQEGWGSGYVDRHRERVGDDGHVVRNDPTPNPYIEQEAGR